MPDRTPAQLRAHADYLTERATEAARQRKVDVAALLLVEAADARDEAERLEGLQRPSRTGKKRAVEAVERLHVSQGRKGASPFQVVANEAGYTIRSLAQTLRAEGWRVSHPYLRQCLDGDANIRLSLAERVQEALGKDAHGKWRWAATRKNWPGKAWAKEPGER